MVAGATDSPCAGVVAGVAVVGGTGLAGVVEVLAAAVDAPPGEGSAALPAFDGGRGDAELVGDLIDGEHAGVFEPVTQAGDVPGSAQLGEGGHGERFSPSAGEALGVEDGRGLVVGCARRAAGRSGRWWSERWCGLPRLSAAGAR